MWFFYFYAWLFSLNIMMSTSIQVVKNSKISSFYFTMHIYHISFIHSSMYEWSVYFHLLVLSCLVHFIKILTNTWWLNRMLFQKIHTNVLIKSIANISPFMREAVCFFLLFAPPQQKTSHKVYSAHFAEDYWNSFLCICESLFTIAKI